MYLAVGVYPYVLLFVFLFGLILMLSFEYVAVPTIATTRVQLIIDGKLALNSGTTIHTRLACCRSVMHN